MEGARAILHYQIMHEQLLQISIQLNGWMLLPYTRAFGELDGVAATLQVAGNKRNFPFISPNGVLQLNLGEEAKVYAKEREKVRILMMKVLQSAFVGIKELKLYYVQFVPKTFKLYSAKFNTKSKEILKLYLLHTFCEKTLETAYVTSVHSHLFAICHSLRISTTIFPEEETLLICRKSHGLEAIPYRNKLSFGLDELASPSTRKENNSSIFCVPSTEDIEKMISAAIQETPSINMEEIEEQKIENLLKTCNYSTTIKNSFYSTKIAFENLKKLYIIYNCFFHEFLLQSLLIPFPIYMQVIQSHRNNTLWIEESQTKNRTNSTDPTACHNITKAEEYLLKEMKEEEKMLCVSNVFKSITAGIKTIERELSKRKLNEGIDFLSSMCKVILNN